MNCVKCYQEIPEGSRFCPYCGAEQTAAPINEQPADSVQPAAASVNEQPADSAQTVSDTLYQDPYNAGDQGAYSYGNSSQDNSYQNNNYQNSSYQNNSYQNGNYQNAPSYQQDQGKTVNGTPYLVTSIILTALSTICCCLLTIPFAVVAIVYSAKINSAVARGDMEEAKKAEKMAKIWLIVAGVVAIVSIILSLVVGAMIGEGAASYYYYY